MARRIDIYITERTSYNTTWDADTLYERYFATMMPRAVFDQLTGEQIAESLSTDSDIDYEDFERHANVDGQTWQVVVRDTED